MKERISLKIMNHETSDSPYFIEVLRRPKRNNEVAIGLVSEDPDKPFIHFITLKPSQVTTLENFLKGLHDKRPDLVV